MSLELANPLKTNKASRNDHSANHAMKHVTSAGRLPADPPVTVVLLDGVAFFQMLAELREAEKAER